MCVNQPVCTLAEEPARLTVTPFGDYPGLAVTLDRIATGLAAVLNGTVAARRVRRGDRRYFRQPRRSATAEVDLTVR